MLASAAVHRQPLAIVLRYDLLDGLFNILPRQVLHEDDWASKEIVDPLVLMQWPWPLRESSPRAGCGKSARPVR
jgi:hypothetical protein